MDKMLRQILENQLHILYVLDAMGQAGNVNPGMYHRDEINERLREETYQLIQDLKT